MVLYGFDVEMMSTQKVLLNSVYTGFAKTA